jgi:hypothetical protein
MNLGTVSYRNVKRRRRSKKLAIAISAVVGAISLLSFVPFQNKMVQRKVNTFSSLFSLPCRLF